jgi:hypothetical protein
VVGGGAEGEEYAHEEAGKEAYEEANVACPCNYSAVPKLSRKGDDL